MSTRQVAASIAAAAIVTLGLAAIGGLVPDHLVFAAAGVFVLLMIGLTAYEPVAVPILAMPALVIVERMPGGLDLSISDFALFGAFWFAVVFAPRPYTHAMRSMLWLSLLYQVASLFTVLANPFTANAVEWFHAWLSVGGALVVGWAIGRAGRARLGLSLYLMPCLAIAALTIVAGIPALAGGSDGVYLEWPYAMHKNYIGCLLGVAALIVYARPWWVGWPRWFAYPAFWFLAAGVALSGARQALVGLAAGLFVIALRKDPDRKRSKFVLLAAIPAVVAVVVAAQEQLESGNEHNSANQRLTWYADALSVWRDSPWFGAGLRWWTSGRTPFVFQPPNAEIEVLSSTGVVGLAGFLIMFLGGAIVLWRMNRRFGTLALALLTQRFVTGQFDLFWSAVQVSVPFVLIGVCLGAEAYAKSRADARQSTGLPLPRDGLRSVEEMASR